MHIGERPEQTANNYSEDLDGLPVYDSDAEAALRKALAHARAQSAEHRNSNPIRGRQMAMVATHAEDALRILLHPVP